MGKNCKNLAEKAPEFGQDVVPNDFAIAAKEKMADGTVGGFCDGVAKKVVFMNQVIRGKSLAFQVILKFSKFYRIIGKS